MDAPTWPELLRVKREQHGLTQAELARKVGVTRQAVGLWESGEFRPRPVGKLAEALDITDAELGALARSAVDEPEPQGDVA